MSTLEWTLVSCSVLLLIYVAVVLGLIVVGRRSQARALAGFIPHCVVLLHRLLADSRVSRGRKLIVFGLIAYLVVPIDLVPDFIPLAGQLDDAIIAAIALRFALRAGRPELLKEHWPGPPESLAVVSRLAYGVKAESPEGLGGNDRFGALRAETQLSLKRHLGASRMGASVISSSRSTGIVGRR